MVEATTPISGIRVLSAHLQTALIRARHLRFNGVLSGVRYGRLGPWKLRHRVCYEHEQVSLKSRVWTIQAGSSMPSALSASLRALAMSHRLSDFEYFARCL